MNHERIRNVIAGLILLIVMITIVVMVLLLIAETYQSLTKIQN